MNTKKILGIFMCMLVMTMIPVAAGANRLYQLQRLHNPNILRQDLLHCMWKSGSGDDGICESRPATSDSGGGRDDGRQDDRDTRDTGHEGPRDRLLARTDRGFR